MTEEPDHISDYSKYLDSTGNHLTRAGLSSYIDAHDRLSAKERDHVEGHLKRCAACKTLFEEVFDFEAELDANRREITLHREPGFDGSAIIRWKDQPSGIVLELSPGDGSLSIRAGAGEPGRNFRISLPGVVVRSTTTRTAPLTREGIEAMKGASVVSLALFGSAPVEASGTRWYRYAVAAVFALALLAAAAFWYLTRYDVPTPQDVASDTAMTNRPPLAVVDPGRFEPHPILEQFTARTVRSSGDVAFLSPANGDTMRFPQTISWTRRKGPHSYHLTILDNRNEAVWDATTGESSVVLNSGPRPGLYYLKLEVNEEMVQVKKVFVLVD